MRYGICGTAVLINGCGWSWLWFECAFGIEVEVELVV